MSKLIQWGIVAALAGASGMAFADTAETNGGIKIKTDDGRFEANLGGRIHFDGNLVHEDQSAFNSATPKPTAQSGFFFRRIYITLTGKLYGWTYKIEPDFAPNNGTGATSIAFQDVYLATVLGPGELQIGQRKPFRAMEDLTSSNDVLMMERPFASSSGGTFKGGSDREFQDGLFYHGNGDMYTWGTSFTTLRRDNTPGTEGWSSSLRGTLAPLNAEASIVHIGANFSYEHPANNQGAASSVTCTTATPPVCTTSTPAGANTAQGIGAGGFAYAGRRGPTINLGSTTKHVGSWGLEYANAFGPWFLQAEYISQLELGDGSGSAPTNQTIQSWYVQTSFFLTGETKPYKKADGVFTNPKPKNSFGAFELTTRYEMAKNKDNPKVCNAAATKCEISALTVGANYYVNPKVRFMLNYVIGKLDEGARGKDSPRTLAARAQLSF